MKTLAINFHCRFVLSTLEKVMGALFYIENDDSLTLLSEGVRQRYRAGIYKQKKNYSRTLIY